MSVIQAGNTTSTAYIVTGDTTGNLVFTTGGANTVALTLANTQAATFASNVTVTGAITATGGIIQGANAAPAFSVYQAIQQTGIPNWTPTKVTFDVELFDTNNNFASSRFTPTVAGYYQFNFAVQIPYGSSSAYISGLLYKNGSTQFGLGTSASGTGSLYPASASSQLVYMNGTTDYIEVFAYGAPNSGSTYSTQPGQANTLFSGFLARSA